MKTRRLLVNLLALSMSLTVFGACGTSGGRTPTSVEEVDLKKSQLYVGCWSGDFGTEWLSTIAQRFEKEYERI